MEKQDTPPSDICPEHNLPYYFICLTDQKQICHHCFYTHKSHDLILLEDLGKSEEMQRQIDSLNPIFLDAKTLIQSINSDMKVCSNIQDKIYFQKSEALKKAHLDVETETINNLSKIQNCTHLLKEKIPECVQIITQIEKIQKEALEILPKIKQGYFYWYCLK